MDDFTPISETTPATLPPADVPHPSEGASSTLGGADSDHEVADLDELTNYRSVPFKIVGRRQVVYRHVGPLRPMSYEYDEDLE